MRREPDEDAALSQRLDLAQVLGDRALPKPRQSRASVRGQQQDDRNACLRCSVRGRERLGEAEVVELADGRIAGGPQLPVHLEVLAAHGLGRLALRLGQHDLAPRPEVPTARPTAQGALEAV
jgi:hypothetical protein